MVVLGVIIAIIVVVALWFMTMYNSFVKLNNKVEEAFATMDVYLKKRFDLIPNLVETVKGYAKHESETLEKVVAARTSVQSAGSPEEKFEAENQLTGTLRTLFAVAESYPDLKANQNFINLQETLNSTEGEIAQSRKYYNAVVRDFNNKVQMFPSSIVAGMFGYTKKPMFEIDEAQRENVQVKF